MLSVALVKVKVVLSAVVNTIFWWSASNHRGQILFSQSDNMDLCCRGLSNGRGGKKAFWKVQQLLSTNNPGGGDVSEFYWKAKRGRVDSEAASSEWGANVIWGRCRAKQAGRALGSASQPPLMQFIQKLVWILNSDVIVRGSCESADLRGCMLNTLRSPSDGTKKKRSEYVL